MNVKELTHSQQQPQAPKTQKRSQQSDKQSEQCSVAPKGVLDEVKCKTINKLNPKRLRLLI